MHRRVCVCASNGMHWFNPITRTTSDQLRQALMLSTTARSKPWYRTVLKLSGGGFADGYGCEVAGFQSATRLRMRRGM